MYIPSMPLPRKLPMLFPACVFLSAWLLVPVLSNGADRGAPQPRPAAKASPDEADRLAAKEIQRLNDSDTERRIRKFAEMVLLPCGVVLVLVLVVRRGFLR